MSIDISDISSLSASIGEPLGVSRWFTINQESINAFGTATQDLEAMHMDPKWSKLHSPFGTTIAYGFQTVSMLTAMINDILPRGSEEAFKLNYGFDRVRLMSPVKEGARIRGKAWLKDLRPRKAGSTIVSIDVEVEIENEEKPALVATWLFLIANDIDGRRRPPIRER